MKQNPFTYLLHAPHLVLAMSSLAALPLLAADPAAVLPDEPAAYMEMDSRAFFKLEDHPVVKTLPLKDLEKLFFKMSGTTPEEQEAMMKRIADEVGMPIEEFQKKDGRIAMSIHDLKIPENPSPENVGGEISLAYEFDGDEALAGKFFNAMVKETMKEVEKQAGPQAEKMKEFFSKAKDMFEESIVKHGGAKIHVLKLKETDETSSVPKFLHEWAYAIHDKMILAASGQEQVEEMLDRMKSGGDTGSLAASPIYKKDHDKAGKTLGMASLNLETILGLVEKYALPMAENTEVDVAKIWKVLGADKLQSAVLAMGAEAETMDLVGLLTYSEKPGLFASFALPGSGKAPEFFPKGLVSAGYQQIDIEKTVDNMIKLAGEIHPQASTAVEMGLNMAKTQVGVDIKKEIIGQLGPDIWIAAAPAGKDDKVEDGDSPQAGASASAMMAMLGKTVLGVRVKDSKAFGLAIDSIVNKVASKEAIFETREYQGFTINNVKESPEEFKVGYVLTDEWLILSVGAGEVLEQILGRLGKSGDDGFFAQKVVAKHLDAMRGGEVSVSVTDLGEMLGSVIGIFEMGFKEGFRAQSGGDAPEIPFDELRKLLNVPLLSIDKAWMDSGHMEYRMRIAPKE